MDGVLIYTINGVERKFICKTYALGQTLKDMKADAGAFHELFGADRIIEFLHTLMYHSAVYAVKLEGKQPDFDRIHVYDWIDSTGGSFGDLYQQFSKIAADSMGLTPVSGNENPSSEEKKSEK